MEDVAFGTAGGAEAVLAAAALADPRALSVISYAAGELGGVVALLVNSLDPEAVIMGGGLGAAEGAYWTALRSAIRAGLWDKDDRPLAILQAALGADAGLIGAALAAGMAGRTGDDTMKRKGPGTGRS